MFKELRLEAPAIGSDQTSAIYAWASIVVAYQSKMFRIEALALRLSIECAIDCSLTV